MAVKESKYSPISLTALHPLPLAAAAGPLVIEIFVVWTICNQA